ncbi:Dip5p [Saccharomyces cerevisiae YJM1478]|nr:Dip5p [Saccharomyces cerevisiae YJM1478]AJV95988.1 Dip5p [Saccharomyces cerevisiae YJM193]AJV98162.1 Dip5p [Saccharomyces cerevisiae YJM271]AJW02070.1 Dip5p [Saccharomyces cerevisiae YJM1386]KZV07244.1 DIP5 [Saccharomyces cerevisiae]
MKMPLKKMFTSTSPRNSSSLDSDHDAYYSKQNPDNFPVKEQEIYNIDLEENNVSSRSSTSTSPSARDDSFAVPDGKDENTRLRKDLKARHISMIAIGGSLGTGLLIGTGTALLTGGPVAMLIAYAFVGLLVFYTMACLGEMASYIPLDGFTSYASRYVDPALGFAIGYTYLFKYFILPPNQLTAAALVIQYWISRDRVNPGVWITIFLVVIVAINVVGVKFFGEFEFWLSSFKVMVMLGLILLLFIIMLGGGPNHDRLGFRYWRDPGAFKEYSTAITGGKGKFVSFVAVFVYSLFSYTGIELTGIVCSEAENPRKSVPKAIKLTVYRIIVFYLCTVFLLGMCVAYNDPRLLSTKGKSMSAAASPFVVAIQNSGIEVLPHIFNACVLVFVFSACNSDLYVSSRNLYALAIDGKAPKIFAKTSRWGVPYNALILSVLFCGLAYMNVSSGSAKIFNYFVNVVSMFGILSWITILIVYIHFDKACRAQGIDKSKFAYVAPGQRYGAYFALFFCILIALIKNFTVFLGHKFDYKTFITGYIGLPVYIISWAGYKLIYKTKVIKSTDVDLYTFKEIYDREEEEGRRKDQEKEERLKSNGKNMEWFYEKFLGNIF